MTGFLLILMIVTSPLWVPVGLTLIGFAMMPVFWLMAFVEDAIDLYKFDPKFPKEKK